MNKMDLFGNKSNNKSNISLIKVLEDFVGCLEHLPQYLLDNIYFKGGLSLLSAMNKYGRYDLERMTKDIDLHCNSIEIWNDIKTNINFLNQHSKLGIHYKIVKIRDISINGKSETLTLEATSRLYTTVLFQIDMNLSNLYIDSEKYTTRYLSIDFTGYSVESILVDKLNVFSSKKIFRRCKDLYDIYAISKLRNVYLLNILEIYITKYGENNLLYVFGFNSDNIKDLEYAYNKLEGINNKPNFNEVYKHVCNFVLPIYTNILNNTKENLVWYSDKELWLENAL